MNDLPAVQSLPQRLEAERVLSYENVSPGAQAFFAVVLAQLFSGKPIVAVTENLRAQEIFQQDLETWLAEWTRATGQEAPRPLFFPAWEVSPQESRLPHADVISERLATLAHLLESPSTIITASVAALQEKSFAPATLKQRLRVLQKGDSWDPLDLIEWLEEQAYDAEAQVTEKGHISMRGGIVDFWPLTSPWPVRLEFFGSQLESMRYFDPITQISREEITRIVIPPGGELGLLKKGKEFAAASLLEYLPSGSLFVLCEPEMLQNAAAHQNIADHPLLISWREFLEQAHAREMRTISLSQLEAVFLEDIVDGVRLEKKEGMEFASLDVFRPIGDRRPEPHIAEAQRKEFFQQMHRWLRQEYSVHLFCNNDGERQRFEEIWWEYGLETRANCKFISALSLAGFCATRPDWWW